MMSQFWLGHPRRRPRPKAAEPRQSLAHDGSGLDTKGKFLTPGIEYSEATNNMDNLNQPGVDVWLNTRW